MTTPVVTDAGRPVKWAGTGTGPTTVTWSLATSNLPGQADAERVPPAPYSAFIVPGSSSASLYKPLVEQAFAAWEKVANVKFVEAPDASNVGIRIGFANLEPAFVGHTAFKFDNNNNFVPGTVVQLENPLTTPVSMTAAGPQYSVGTTVLQDLISQIGRALGLNGSTDDPGSVLAPILGPANLMPDAGDIAAIQSLYGAPAPPPPPPPVMTTTPPPPPPVMTTTPPPPPPPVMTTTPPPPPVMTTTPPPPMATIATSSMTPQDFPVTVMPPTTTSPASSGTIFGEPLPTLVPLLPLIHMN